MIVDIRTMQPTKVLGPPLGSDWQHEIKFDGIRCIMNAGRKVSIYTRSGIDVTAKFPEIRADGINATLDGELVVGYGKLGDLPGVLSRLEGKGNQQATFIAFDILRLRSNDMTSKPLRERREALESLPLLQTGIRITERYREGIDLLAYARNEGLEGVVSKRIDSAYTHSRSTSWLKVRLV